MWPNLHEVAGLVTLKVSTSKFPMLSYKETLILYKEDMLI